MSMEQIRKTYGVPAKRGGRVEYTGYGFPELGTIVSATGSELRIRLDNHKNMTYLHPKAKLRYLEDIAK